MAAGSPLLQMEQVNKYFGDLHVLQDVDLEVDPGEVVIVVGPSGSGKSTLCRTINRLEPIDGGTIRLEGQPLPSEGRALARLRSDVGMVFQQFNLFAHKSVLENVTLGPIKVRGQSRKEAERRARELLARVGVENQAHKLPGPALGRPAAAGGDRPRPGHGPQAAAVRRADLGPRPGDDQRGPRRHARPGRGRHDHDRDQPRDGLRPLGGQPGRVHGRRPDPGGGPARGVLRQPADRAGQGLPVQDHQLTDGRPEPPRQGGSTMRVRRSTGLAGSRPGPDAGPGRLRRRRRGRRQRRPGQRGGQLRRGHHHGPAQGGRARSRSGPSSTSPCSASRTWRASRRASTSRSPS